MIHLKRNIISACKHATHSFTLRINTLLLPFITSLFLFASCGQDQKKETSSSPADTTNHFTDRAVVKYAKGFNIAYFGNYKVVTIVNSSGAHADSSKYLLVERGTAVPAGFESAQKIFIPVRTMVATSSTHIALADFAESPNIITGLSDTKYISSPTVLKNVKDGKVKGVGGESNLNNEMVIAMHPDVVMATGSQESPQGRFQTITGAGVPVLQNSEWLETTPLARAEWVKLMAALLNKEALVNKKFSEVEKNYNNLKELAKKAVSKPSVIIAMPFKGTWFVPAGQSFVAQFLRDANSNYEWSGTEKTGSLALSFETVAPIALNADFWLNVGFIDSKKEIAAVDKRYTFFKPFVTNKVYNFNKRVNELKSNDYWESAVVHPDVVLADLIKILHPELLPAHELVYYKQLL